MRRLNSVAITMSSLNSAALLDDLVAEEKADAVLGLGGELMEECGYTPSSGTLPVRLDGKHEHLCRASPLRS
jgi:hypothetical protein